MNKYLSIIGYQGPKILFIFIVIGLIKKHIYNPYIYGALVLWQTVNHLINVVIKNTLKSPRPDVNKSDQNKMDQFNKLVASINYKNYLIIHRNFGMPSGHAQSVLSEFAFIALYFKNPLLTAVSAIQVAITLYQRYALHRHSIKQLAAGSALGIIVGAVFYILIK
jgi:membrane-associated phospholipid phosphatase